MGTSNKSQMCDGGSGAGRCNPCLVALERRGIFTCHIMARASYFKIKIVGYASNVARD